MDYTFLKVVFDIFNTALGAFIGFIFALFLQRRTEKKHKRDMIKLVLTNILEELSDISSSLQQYIDHKKCLNCRIQTPSWDSILNSGIMLEMIEQPNYSSIIKAYSLIRKFNDDRINQTSTEDISNMYEIIEISRRILESID